MEESCNLPKSLLHESLEPVSQSPQSSSAGVTTRTGKAQLRYISVTSTACQPSHLDGRRASSSPALTPREGRVPISLLLRFLVKQNFPQSAVCISLARGELQQHRSNALGCHPVSLHLVCVPRGTQRRRAQPGKTAAVRQEKPAETCT